MLTHPRWLYHAMNKAMRDPLCAGVNVLLCMGVIGIPVALLTIVLGALYKDTQYGVRK